MPGSCWGVGLLNTRTSVCPVAPNCAVAAMKLPAGTSSRAWFGFVLLNANGPFQAPSASIQKTCSTPMTSAMKTSVWFVAPNCGLTAIGAPFGANGAPDPTGYEAGPIGVVV